MFYQVKAVALTAEISTAFVSDFVLVFAFLEMAPRTRRGSFPTVVIERETESEESSSSEEEEDPEPEVLEEEEAEELAEVENGKKAEEGLGSKKKERVPITIALTKVCKVMLPLFFFALPGFIFIFFLTNFHHDYARLGLQAKGS